MGHREQLMAGAKNCLEERGYARTTSRDIAGAAKAPVGSICYHYGSKEALLNAALLESIQAWGDATVRAATNPATATETGDTEAVAPPERLWGGVIEASLTHRAMLVASMEALAQAERFPEIRRQIAEAFERSRPEMAAGLHGIDPAADEATARAVGSVHMALVAGLSQQWLIDPERAPSAAEVAAGLRAIARSLETFDPGDGPTSAEP